MVSAWFPPGTNPVDVNMHLRRLPQVQEIYAWWAEFDEVHSLVIFKEPCGLSEKEFTGAFLAEGIASWQHSYRQDLAERQPFLSYWSVNSMEVE